MRPNRDELAKETLRNAQTKDTLFSPSRNQNRITRRVVMQNGDSGEMGRNHMMRSSAGNVYKMTLSHSLKAETTHLGLDSRALLHQRRPVSQRQAPRQIITSDKQMLRAAIPQSRMLHKNTRILTFQTKLHPSIQGGEHIQFLLPDGRKASEFGSLPQSLISL